MTRAKKTPLQVFNKAVELIYNTCDWHCTEVDVPKQLSDEQKAAALQRLAEARTAVLRFSHRIERLRPQEVLQRRMAGFEGLVIKAAQGDVKPLIDYLLSSEATENERNLGWLLDRWRAKLPQRRGLSDNNWAVECAAYLVWIGKRAWCARHNTKRANKNTPMNALIERAIELVKPSNPDAGEFAAEKVREKVREAQRYRPSSVISDHMREFMPAAVAAFIEEAKTLELETDE
jgi:hypothetical protein